MSNPYAIRSLSGELSRLREIRIEEKNFGYFIKNETQSWEPVWNVGMRGVFAHLSPEDGERFKREHLEQVRALPTTDGIWL